MAHYNGIHMINKTLLLILLLFGSVQYSLTTNMLHQGDAFNSSSHFVSQNRIYSLGFRGRFLGIWYTDDFDYAYEVHPLWTANRYKPIANDTANLSLSIDSTGTLKITYEGGNPIVLYSSEQSQSRNITAVLENSGNFVLKEAMSPQILWQSFDYPTDTLLPGMKLGINHKTGMKWSLLSWLAEDNPSPGAFTMDWDPSVQQIIVKRRGIVFWSSGRKFENIPLLDPWNSNYKFNIVSTMDEEYMSYYLYTDKLWPLPPEEAMRAKISMWFLDYRGDIAQSGGRLDMLGSDVCDGNSTYSGCQKWDLPTCRRPGDRFAVRGGSFFPYGHSINGGNETSSFIDCKDICWNTCKCSGFLNTIRNGNSTGCILYSGTFDDKDLTGFEQSYYVILPGPPLNGDKTWIRIVIAVGISAIVVLLAIFLYLRYRRLKLEEKFLKELMTADRASDANELKNTGNKGNNLQLYSVSSITTATNGFSVKNKLGEGGFGPVYRGELAEGQKIAVKKLSRRSGQGLVEFKNELILISKLQHMNLVRLLGFCIKGEEKMLVYEYMPNKSLDTYIFDQSKRELLDWNRRFNIIEGIAQGLLYLHKYSRLRIIHRDLKASNILLDEDMNPKISDFGMARIFKADEPEANTNRVVGTYGYMSPEYAMQGIFSVKSDVYSFGVLVLEILSGKKNQSIHQFGRVLNLVGYAWGLWIGDSDPLELMDPVLCKSASTEQVLRCINIGLLCAEHSPVDRPNMSDVLCMLTSDVQLPMPKQPAFYTGGGNTVEPNASEIRIVNFSLNDMSLSDEMNGR